nr:hypothetical protein [Paracoccus yeei]
MERPLPPRWIKHPARHPVGEMPDDRRRKLRRRHDQVLRRRVLGRHQAAPPGRGSAHHRPHPKQPRDLQHGRDCRAQISLERDDRRPADPDADGKLRLAEALGAALRGQHRRRLRAFGRPAPAQAQHRHHRDKGVDTPFSPLERPQRRQADLRHGGDIGLRQAAGTARGAEKMHVKNRCYSLG